MKIPRLVALLALTACGSAAPQAAAPSSEAASSGAPAKTPDETPAPAAAPAPPPPPPPSMQTTPPAQATPSGEGGKNQPGQAAVVEDSQLLGALTTTQILDILQKNGDLFGPCYTMGAGGKNKSYTAKVVVKASIGPSGNVNAAEVARSTTHDKKVDQCVVDAFKKMKFPKPKNGQAQVISFPIDFDGMEEVPAK